MSLISDHCLVSLKKQTNFFCIGVVYTKTIIRLGVGETYGYLPLFTSTLVNDCKLFWAEK